MIQIYAVNWCFLWLPDGLKGTFYIALITSTRKRFKGGNGALQPETSICSTADREVTEKRKGSPLPSGCHSCFGLILEWFSVWGNITNFMCSYLIEEENNCCNDWTAYIEIMDNLGIHFSIKERNVVGVALFLLVSLTERARAWSMHLQYSVIRRKCRACSGASLGPWNFALWADTGKATRRRIPPQTECLQGAVLCFRTCQWVQIGGCMWV